MPKAVRFDTYGGIDVLKVAEVPRPVPGPGQVLVQVKAAGINPGEAKIRDGLLHARWPATFPSGQGSDLAGIVAETGPGVTAASVGDEVIGFTDNRASQAEYVVVEEGHLTPKPADLPWVVAGALFVAGATAYAAVRAVAPADGDTVVVSGAAGGVGSLAVQLARRAGATVIGLAGPDNHEWLAAHGVIPVAYGDGVAERIRQRPRRSTRSSTRRRGLCPAGPGPGRRPGPDRHHRRLRGHRGARRQGRRQRRRGQRGRAGRPGQADRGRRAGRPVAATFPLAEVRDAYQRLAQGHVQGKIVLLP